MLNTVSKRFAITFGVLTPLPTAALITYFVSGLIAYAAGTGVDVGMTGGQIVCGWLGLTLALAILTGISIAAMYFTDEDK
jgi:hypothetical protein